MAGRSLNTMYNQLNSSLGDTVQNGMQHALGYPLAQYPQPEKYPLMKIKRGNIIVIDEEGRCWNQYETVEEAHEAATKYLSKHIGKFIICTQLNIIESNNTVVVQAP